MYTDTRTDGNVDGKTHRQMDRHRYTGFKFIQCKTEKKMQKSGFFSYESNRLNQNDSNFLYNFLTKVKKRIYADSWWKKSEDQ